MEMEYTVKEFKANEVIFSQGDNEAFMYELLEGRVGIYVQYGTEEQVELTVLEAGEGVFFGEMGLIDGMPRSADAVALEDVRVCTITDEMFGNYFVGREHELIGMMKNMSSRIRALTAQYLEACGAVTEAVESERSGKGLGGWFRGKAERFMKDYAESTKYICENDPVSYIMYIEQ